MKKIIYSFVIMIAAGSLFTSCVTNTEPQGIKDLREAKAGYLDALASLRAADAEFVKAEAALVQAKTETEKAVAAYNQAIAEAKQIENEIQKARNEKEVEELKAQMDSIRANAELEAVKAAKKLANAQAKLEETLKKIAAESIGLTGAEKEAITNKTAALNWAYSVYNRKLNDYNVVAKALWEAEYNVAAGVEGYETAESYLDSVAKYEEKIADANEEIASLEALKEHPQAVKDSLDALDAQIAAIEEQIFLSTSDKVLYESTPEFADAKKEFAKRVSDFVKDSLNNATDVFVYADKESNAVTYPLTNGEGLDKNFGAYVGWFKDKNGKTAPNYGIKVSTDFKNIEVKGGKQALDSAQAILNKIIETLDRELVVVKDSTAAKEYEALAKAAAKADTTYMDHRAILEAGLEAWDPYKDSVKKIEPLKKKLDTARDAYKAAYQKLVEDSVNVVTTAKTLASAYKTAVKGFVYEADRNNPDSADFLAATVALGNAQAAYLGIQDSVTIQREYVVDGEKETLTRKVAFSSLTKADFVKNTNIFSTIKTAANCDSDVTEENVAHRVGNQQTKPVDLTQYDRKDFAYKVIGDTIPWLKKFVFAKDVFTADSTALAKAGADTATAHNAVANYDGVDKAIKKYIDIYKSFNGIKTSPVDTAKACKPQTFNWTANTFEKPFCCVLFSGDEVVLTDTLKVILNQIDPEGIDNDGKVVSTIFKKDTLTEYSLKLKAAQLADAAKNFEFYTDQFNNIKAQVAAIKKDVDAAYAAWEEANKGVTAVKVRLFGYKKDGKTLNVPADTALVEANVNVTDGKWAFGGYLLEWAEELAPEYPAIVKDATTNVAEIREDQANLIKYRYTLDLIYTLYSDFFENPDYAAWNVQGIIYRLDAAIEEYENDIEEYKAQIKVFEKSIAECEAGYSNAEVKVNYWKSVLAQKEIALEQAAEALARAQKEYDEVIAAYGVRRAE